MSRAKRAKQTKKFNKLTLLVLVLIVATLMFAINNKEINILGIITNDKKQYNSNDYLKDAFTTEDGTKILPFVYKNADEQIKKSDIEARMKSEGITIKKISSETIATGTTIETDRGNYTVLIYGDANNDGRVNVRDIRKIVQHIIYGSTYELKGINKTAANLENISANTINVRDARKIVKFILGKDKIIESIPESDRSKDKEPPVITLNGANPMNLELNEKYVEPGATVTDNLDTKPTLTISYPDGKNTIDTSKAGTYVVTYTAKDFNGNQAAKKERIVNVIDNTKPTITLNGDAQIYLNLGDTYTDLGAKAEDKNDGVLKYTVEPTTIDTSKAGTYTIRYTTENSKGEKATVERNVTVIDYIKNITLSGRLLNSSYKEGERISLSGIKAKITVASGSSKEYDLATIKEEYSLSYSEDLKITLTQNGTNTTGRAEYDNSADYKNSSSRISIKLEYINGIDNEKNKTVTLDTNTISVTGKIREFIKVENVTPVGIVYDTFVIGKYKTPTNQENIKYEENKIGNNVSVEIKTAEGSDASTAHVYITTDASGISTIKFYADSTGTYTVRLKSTSAKAVEITVNVIGSTEVNAVEYDSYDGVLREGGTEKDIPLRFVHSYTTSNGENGSYAVTGVKSKDVTIEENAKLTIKRLGKNGEGYKEIDASSEEEIVGIRVKANEGSFDNSHPDEPTNTTIKLTIKNESGKPDGKGNVEVKIYEKSVFTIYSEQKDVNIYLDQSKVSGEDKVFVDSNDIYTLVKVIAKNQYEGVDKEERKVNASELSEITFLDNANAKSYFKVIGLKEKAATEYEKVESGEIDYIGIALNDEISENDEDEKIEGKQLEVRQHGNMAFNLKIGVVKKDITTLRLTNMKEKEYCYDYSKVAFTVETGEKEANLLESDISNLEITVTKVDGAEEVTDNDIKVVKEYNESNHGINVKLSIAKSGKFKVKASLNKDGKKVEVESEKNIEIVDNPIVNRIEFTYSEKDKYKDTIGDGEVYFGTVRPGKPVTNAITYYHIYFDESGRELGRHIIPSDNAPLATNITIPEETSKMVTVKINGNTKQQGGALEKVHVEKLLIKAKDENVTQPTKTSFTIKINNVGVEGIETTEEKEFTETVYVYIDKKVEATTLNIVPVFKNSQTGTPTLYNKKPAEGDIKEETIQHQLEGQETQQLDYTIFKLDVRDQDGDPFTIRTNQIHNNTNQDNENKLDDGLTLLDSANKNHIGDPATSSRTGLSRISVIGLEYDETRKTYTYISPNAVVDNAAEDEDERGKPVKIEYIGIALNTAESVDVNGIYLYYAKYENKVFKDLVVGGEAVKVQSYKQ